MVLSFPPLRFTLRSLKRLLADERAGERAELERLVALAQMPGQQTPAVALDGLRLVDRPVQRCGS